MTIIQEGTKDIFRSKCQTLVCPVNTVGVMGAGLAKAFKEKYPGLNAFYRNACEEGELTIDTLMIWTVPGKKRKVLLFPTKQDWRAPSNIEWIEANLRELARFYCALGVESLAMPAVGCGCGGLDWHEQVRDLTYRHLYPISLQVEIALGK